jgi:hypothetical protein
MDNYNLKNDESLTNVFQYVTENYIGLLLFLFSFLIIYFVDYINYLNMLVYSMQSPIPVPNLNKISSVKKVKFKK